MCKQMLGSVPVKADMQDVCIDSTVARAQACTAKVHESNATAKALGHF